MRGTALLFLVASTGSCLAASGSGTSSSSKRNSVTQQNPAINPPVPIILLSEQYIKNQAVENSSSLPLLHGRDNTGALLCGPDLPCADGR